MSFSVSFAIGRRRYGPRPRDGPFVAELRALFPQIRCEEAEWRGACLDRRRTPRGRMRSTLRISTAPGVYGSRLMTKLVIVDDHEALREGLVALLQHGGIEVVGAAGNV